MMLVVDAEVIFAALIGRGFTLDMIKILTDNDFKLISPEYVFEEIYKRKNKIVRFSGLNEVEIDFVLNIIFEKIDVIPKNEYIKYIDDARRLSPHKRDVPYFALALAKNASIWSNEKSFKKQEKIKVFSTQDLKKMLFQ